MDEPDLLQLFEQAPSFLNELSRLSRGESPGDSSATSSKILLDSNRLGVFGVVLYAEFDPPRAPVLSRWLGFVRDGRWVSLGGGGVFLGDEGGRGPKRLMVREPRQVPNGLYIIPIGGGSHSSDEIDPSGRWLTVFSTELHATSEVARVVVGDGDKERELLPPSHGNLVVLYEGPDFPGVTADDTAFREWIQRKISTRAYPDVRAYDSAGRELMHGIDQQPGFDEWVERRRRQGETW